MKLWLFYLKTQGFDVVQPYAFTNERDLAKRFRNDRDPEVVHMIIKKDVDREYFNALIKEHPGFRLHEGYFYTKSSVYGKMKRVSIVCTYDEEMQGILSMDRFWNENSMYLIDPSMFTDEYREALEKLQMGVLYRFYVEAPMKRMFYGFDSDDIAMPADIRYDELQLFIHKFKNTFRKE